MGETTKIEWTDATWNPWQGCRKVSQGCKNCYMYRDKTRYGQDPSVVVRSAPATFRGPLSTKKYPPGALVFTCSWSDWFIEEADAWRDEAWAIVRARPDLTFQILTKRSDRIDAHLPEDWGMGYPNVWLGVSVEDRKALPRVDDLVRIPAVVRFLSVEPLLEAVDVSPYLGGVHWVIVGGESGPDARPMHPQWARDIRDQCDRAGVPLLFKQWGEWLPDSEVGQRNDPDLDVDIITGRYRSTAIGLAPGNVAQSLHPMHRVGKARAGRLLDGATHDDLPVVGGSDAR